MLEDDKGLFIVKGYNTRRRFYALDVKADYVGLASFILEPDERKEGETDWADIEAFISEPDTGLNKSGMPDLRRSGELIEDFPLSDGKVVKYMGRVYFHLDGMNGVDEIVDYSLVDLATTGEGIPLPWRNRFAASAREKIDTSFRHRARSLQQVGAVVFMPLAVSDLSQARIEVVTGPEGVILLNDTKETGTIDGPTVIPNDGKWYEQFYFKAQAPADLFVPAGGNIDIPIQLNWQKPDEPNCAAEVTLKVEEVSGFFPQKRLRTDGGGAATLTAMALGLKPGDLLVAKIGTDHFSAVGKITVEVV